MDRRTDVSFGNSGPLRFLRGSNLEKQSKVWIFLIVTKSQEKILDKLKNIRMLKALRREVSIHSSQTHHSSKGNLENKLLIEW